MPRRLVHTLPYIPTALAKPPPAFESSVFSWLTIPVLLAITLTLQKRVLAIAAPFPPTKTAAN